MPGLPEGARVEDADGVDPDALAAARRLGDAWSASRRSLALRVPSAVVRAARNVVPDPDHPDYASLRVVSIDPCPFDPRLARPEG